MGRNHGSLYGVTMELDWGVGQHKGFLELDACIPISDDSRREGYEGPKHSVDECC